jgi:flagellar biosynthesis component FlhA
LKEQEISLVLETCCPYVNQSDNLELDIITHDNNEELKANNQQDTAKEKSDVDPTMPGENPLLKQRMRSGREKLEMCKVIHLLCSTPPVRSLVKELGQKVCGH